MKRGTMEHPKFIQLCTALKLTKFEAAGLLETLWHFTAKFTPQGDIGKYSDEAIAKWVGWRVRSGSLGVPTGVRLTSALVQSGWLDRSEAHRLVVHDWAEHIDQSLKRNLASRKLALIQHDASKLQQKTSYPEPEPEPEPIEEETNKEENAAGAACEFELQTFTEQPNGKSHVAKNGKRGKRTSEEIRKDLGPRFTWWSEFWAVFPCKNGMNPAMDVFERRVRTREIFDSVLAGAKSYASKTARDPDMKLKYAQGWLTDERWTDSPLRSLTDEYDPIKNSIWKEAPDYAKLYAEQNRLADLAEKEKQKQ